MELTKSVRITPWGERRVREVCILMDNLVKSTKFHVMSSDIECWKSSVG